ncbi:hypothetical protein MNBD_ALPHA11-37, partial [hydrothermal vent metagenome]
MRQLPTSFSRFFSLRTSFEICKGWIFSKLRFVRLFASFGLLLFVAACANQPNVILKTANGDITFEIELADTPKSRADGLMFRNELAPNAGMLFDFQEEREVSFWMRNTFIPL